MSLAQKQVVCEIALAYVAPIKKATELALSKIESLSATVESHLNSQGAPPPAAITTAIAALQKEIEDLKSRQAGPGSDYFADPRGDIGNAMNMADNFERRQGAKKVDIAVLTQAAANITSTGERDRLERDAGASREQRRLDRLPEALGAGSAYAHAEGGKASITINLPAIHKCPRCEYSTPIPVLENSGATCPKPACGGPTLISTRNISVLKGGGAAPQGPG